MAEQCTQCTPSTTMYTSTMYVMTNEHSNVSSDADHVMMPSVDAILLLLF